MSLRTVSELLSEATAKIRKVFENTALEANLLDVIYGLSTAADKYSEIKEFLREEEEHGVSRDHMVNTALTEMWRSVRTAYVSLGDVIRYFNAMNSPFTPKLEEVRRKLDELETLLHRVVVDCSYRADKGVEKFTACVRERLPDIDKKISELEEKARELAEMTRTSVKVVV